MKHRFCTYIIGLLCLFFTLPSWSQNNQLRAYTLEDGLPQSQVYDITQDRLGYLWLGTQGGGIAQFDGLTFTIWNTKNGLASNYIHALHFSGDTLLIGTRQGLSVKVKKTFENYKIPQVNAIRSFNGKIYLATLRGVFVFDGKSAPRRLDMEVTLDKSQINDIAFDGKRFWVASRNGLWNMTDLADFPSDIEKTNDDDIKSLAIFKDQVLAASYTQGISRYKEDRETFTIVSHQSRINAITILNEDELWISSDNNGITCISLQGKAPAKKINRQNGLGVNHIRKVMKDIQGNIWIASSGGGLYKYAKNNFNHFDRSEGLKANHVYATHYANKAMWISMGESGLAKIDSLGVQPVTEDEGFLDVKIKTIASDKTNRIWAGTEGKGIFIYKKTMRDSIVFDSTFKAIDTLKVASVYRDTIDVKKGLPSNWIQKIQMYGSNIWVATYADGIAHFKYDEKRKKIYNVTTYGSNEGILDLGIKDLQRDATGRVWYATKKGHLGYIKKGKVTHLGNLLDTETTIGSIVFHDYDLYVGTFGKGIWWSDLSEPIKLQKLTGEKYLYSENIFQLLFSSDTELWAGSERGVDQITLNNNAIVDVKHYGRNDGFLGIETCHNAITKDDNNNLWFGTIFGLSQYKPSKEAARLDKPQLQFEEIKVAHESLDSINLKTWTNSNKRLFLNEQQNYLRFDYRSVDLNNPETIMYRHKLDDKDWTPWTFENTTNFAGLAFGDHTFTVQSRNKSWIQSNPISFKFHVVSPLHKKRWFKNSAWTLLGIICVFIIWSYIKRIKNKNRAVRERLQLENHLLSLEQKALRLQMNPHFIFNVLNGIKGMSRNDTDKMNTTINTFATLLRNTLTNSRQQHITLAQEIKTLQHYIEIEQLMSSKPFTYAIETHSDLDLEEVLIPPMLIQPFVENAIRHGIMAVQREGELKVIFSTDDNFLYAEILDNGIGINESKKQKQKTDHQSMALQVTKDRIESLSGKNTLKITERIEADKTVSGTKVAFKIPLETEY